MSGKIQIHTYQNMLSTLCLFFTLLIFPAHIQSKPTDDKTAKQVLTFSSPLTVRWQFDSKNTTNFSPSSNNGHLYLPLTSGEIVSLNVSNGELLWRTEIGGDFSTSPISDERGVYLASRTEDPNNPRQTLHSTGAIRALSQATGITLWMRTLHFPIQGGLVSSATKLFGGSADGRVYAFNKATGEILWVYQHTSPFSSFPTLHDKRLYIGSEDGNLLALDESSGTLLWRYRTRGALRGTVAVADNTIFFGSADGYVYAYNEISGRLLWRRRTGAAVRAVVLTNDGIVVTSLDNFVYLLTPRRGDLIWKRQLAGRIAALPLIDIRSALFAPLGGDACVVLSLRDGKQLNTLPVGEEGITGATPILADNLLLIPTRRGLMAFAASPSDSDP
jgi:outer membrane protein assembly factor BamB